MSADGDVSDDALLRSVVGVMARLGSMLGTYVRAFPDVGGPPVVGVLRGFTLAQDGGAGGVYVVLDGHDEFRVERVDPAELPTGRADRALPRNENGQD